MCKVTIKPYVTTPSPLCPRKIYLGLEIIYACLLKFLHMCVCVCVCVCDSFKVISREIFKSQIANRGYLKPACMKSSFKVEVITCIVFFPYTAARHRENVATNKLIVTLDCSVMNTEFFINNLLEEKNNSKKNIFLLQSVNYTSYRDCTESELEFQLLDSGDQQPKVQHGRILP